MSSVIRVFMFCGCWKTTKYALAPGMITNCLICGDEVEVIGVYPRGYNPKKDAL